MKTTTVSTPASDVWVTIGTFDHLTEAKALKTALEHAGVEASLQDERKLQKSWFAAKARAGVHVAVHEDCLDKARDYINNKTSVQAAFRKAIRCPDCQSSRVQYPQMTRKNMLPTLLAKTLVAVGALQHEYYCEDCHFTWPRAAKPSSRARKPRSA